jgi:2-polyprenyl-6-methoxyphenol hydroxylase-like FAD-dependent oxidoreductase
MEQHRLTVLISGAGIAGSTLAALLGRAGHQVAVVERDQGVRSSGNPVDVRKGAYRIAEQLDVLGRLQEVATRVRHLIFVDDLGRPVARMPTRQSATHEIEVPRADLSAILVAASQGQAEFMFDDMITQLHPDDGGVNVVFDRAAPLRFDLVVGADGIHSAVRRLAFGPEAAYVRPLGMYVATAKLGIPLERDDTVIMYNKPGTAVALHPGAGSPGVAFMFRSSTRIDYRDLDARRHLLMQTYRDHGWRTEELLSAYLASDDVYFDSVSRIRLPSWSRGRVTLLGDAADCVSLFGDGSSSAMEGAATLAASLAASPYDIPTAFARYESAHRKITRPRQRVVPIASHLLIPKTRLGIALRDRALRLAYRRKINSG